LGPLYVELEQLTEDEITSDFLEQHLKQIWQRSYARFANEEQNRLQSFFVQRGRALKSLIIPNRTARQRLYRTSLAPRAAQVLLRQYPTIRLHLAGGGNYAVSSFEDQIAYLQTLLTHISAMPMFEVTPLKIGNSRHLTPASVVLNWWLAPEISAEKPTAKTVSDWHHYISKNFVYRLNWALGSVLSLAVDESHDGELQGTSIQDWPKTGLPWIAFWIKELMTWGTLDPVVAYLLSRSLAPTRREAGAIALRYYTSRRGEVDANDLLHPGRIRDWADEEYQVDRRRRRIQSHPPFPVDLARDFSNAPKVQWRVLPTENGSQLYWYDPAGFLMGTSTKPVWWEVDSGDKFDFQIDSSLGTVNSEFYL